MSGIVIYFIVVNHLLAISNDQVITGKKEKKVNPDLNTTKEFWIIPRLN